VYTAGLQSRLLLYEETAVSTGVAAVFSSGGSAYHHTTSIKITSEFRNLSVTLPGMHMP